jgi:hypothetical protein
MRSLWFLAPLLWACSDSELAIDGSDVSADQLRARAGDTTVWIRDRFVRTDIDGRTDLVATGRTSRNLTDGNVFVFDDPYGRFGQRSARTYEIGFATSELTTLMVGVQTFVRLHFAPSSSRPDSLTARVVARPRLTDFGGSGIYLVQPAPVSVGGRPVLRIDGTSSRGLQSIEVFAGEIQIPDATLLSPRALRIDLPLDHAIALAGADERITIRATSATGALTKSARLELAMGSFELTTGDPYEVWPPATCDAAVSSCLAALAPGSLDLSSCGSYLEVAACGGSGVLVDDVAFQAALARAADRAEAMRDDAAALVGPDRLESFVESVRLTIESRLEPYFGARYGAAAERDAALDAEIDAGIDAAYARPLDLTEALASLPNDPVRARNVSADALLAYLSTFDTTGSEWGRPLEELTRTYRARHVGALRELREVGPIALSTATEDIYTVDWLDALVEVTIDRASGNVVRVLLEID